MKKIVIMMFAVALALLLTVSFAVTNVNFEFTLPADYKMVEENLNVGIYQKEGTVLMYGVKSIFDEKHLKISEFDTGELITLIKEMYGEENPIIQSKKMVKLKNTEAVNVNIINENDVKSSLYFTNSDSKMIMIAFSGTVFDMKEINSILSSFEVKGLNKQYAIIMVGAVVVFIFLLGLASKRNKK